MTAITEERFKRWLDESQQGDVVQIKTRFNWVKKVIAAVDETWVYFYDSKVKKSTLSQLMIKPVMMPLHLVVKEFNRLPVEQKIILRDALKLAGLGAFAGNGETIDDAFIRILKADKSASYKARQVAINLVKSGTVEKAMDMTIEARELYLKEKSLLESVEGEIERYFLAKGWIKKEIHPEQFWWVKNIKRDGIQYRDHVLHGIEAGTNQYIHVFGTYDADDKEINENPANYFSDFASVKEFIEGKK